MTSDGVRVSKFHRISLPEVIVSAGKTANTLGVVRCFGRRGIPVTLVETTLDSPARYSRYVSRRLRPPESENLTNTLIDLLRAAGEQADRKRVIIPTGDKEVVALAGAREELRPYYLFSLPQPEVLESLIDKSRFYPFLAQHGYPHPQTAYPADMDELLRLGRKFPLPFLIKPADSLLFQDRYMRKCFQVTSIQELDQAADLLEGSNLRLMIQEIIPGDQFYEFSVYLAIATLILLSWRILASSSRSAVWTAARSLVWVIVFGLLFHIPLFVAWCSVAGWPVAPPEPGEVRLLSANLAGLFLPGPQRGDPVQRLHNSRDS